MRRILASVIGLLLVLSLAACSNSDTIVGKWQDDMGTYDFKSNGKLVAESDFATKSGKYEVEGENLTVSINGQKQEITYKVEGDTLTLISEDGESVELTKVE